MQGNSKLKAIWLSVFVTLVVLMIGVGGATRLTRSGLSIVEWKPISGVIPPLNETEWQAQFDLYKQSPEFQKVNSHFELSDYKKIFIWEYLHRVLGRLIFLFALLPGLYLWEKKQVSLKFVLGLSLLVAAQGLVGWIMVKSGLNTQPHVSPYFLALHFFFALTVLLTAYYHFHRGRSLPTYALDQGQRRMVLVLGLVLFFQLFYGCLTSGWKAGLMYNTYPLMGGDFFPEAGFSMQPAVLNFLQNPAFVQWTHRWLGMSVLILVSILTWSVMKTISLKNLRGAIFHLLGLVGLQVILGILNLLYMIPIPLAVSHQVLAVMIVLGYFKICLQIQAPKRS